MNMCDINTVTRTQLKAVEGICEKTANKILQERQKNGQFLSEKDFKHRLQLKRSFAQAFIFPPELLDDKQPEREEVEVED